MTLRIQRGILFKVGGCVGPGQLRDIFFGFLLFFFSSPLNGCLEGRTFEGRPDGLSFGVP